VKYLFSIEVPCLRDTNGKTLFMFIFYYKHNITYTLCSFFLIRIYHRGSEIPISVALL